MKTATGKAEVAVLPGMVRHYIDGEWADAASGRTYADSDPWSGATLATVAAGDGEDGRHAVEAAQRAFPAWAGLLPAARQAVFLHAAENLQQRKEKVAAQLAAETGCGNQFSAIQIKTATALLRQAAQLPYAATGQLIPSDVAGTEAMALRRPVGVVAAITPWNASLLLAARGIVAPLALGNTVVLKPSEESPYTGGTLWAEILAESGLPAGVLNVVTHAPGEAGSVGDELVAHPGVRRLNFTGSTATGRRLAEQAGRYLKRVVMQLSGHSPLIVLGDADLDYAVNASAYGSFVYQGQVCMCARRIYVEQAIAEEFCHRFATRAAGLPMGDPSNPATVIGPVINQWALALLQRRVDEAVSLGAEVLAGGSPKPPCYPATVLRNVSDRAELSQEETFGPVVMVEVVADADQAIERANASRFGLAASVITGDPYRGMEMARRLAAGIVHVNDQPVNDEPQMPFGGVKDSGWGRFGVGFAAEDFCDLQWVTVRRGARDFPF